MFTPQSWNIRLDSLFQWKEIHEITITTGFLIHQQEKEKYPSSYQVQTDQFLLMSEQVSVLEAEEEVAGVWLDLSALPLLLSTTCSLRHPYKVSVRGMPLLEEHRPLARTLYACLSGQEGMGSSQWRTLIGQMPAACFATSASARCHPPIQPCIQGVRPEWAGCWRRMWWNQPSWRTFRCTKMIICIVYKYVVCL